MCECVCVLYLEAVLLSVWLCTRDQQLLRLKWQFSQLNCRTPDRYQVWATYMYSVGLRVIHYFEHAVWPWLVLMIQRRVDTSRKHHFSCCMHLSGWFLLGLPLLLHLIAVMLGICCLVAAVISSRISLSLRSNEFTYYNILQAVFCGWWQSYCDVKGQTLPQTHIIIHSSLWLSHKNHPCSLLSDNVLYLIFRF
jgi:hypothetical protein